MFRHHTRFVDTPDGTVVEDRPTRPTVLVTPAQVVSAVGGVVLIAFGVFAVVRAGLDNTLNDPTVDVLGLTHTAAIGIGEIIVGAVLVLSALSPLTRVLAGVIGLALLVFGIVLLAGPSDLLARMHTERQLGWLGVIVGGVVLLASLVTPWSRRTSP